MISPLSKILMEVGKIHILHASVLPRLCFELLELERIISASSTVGFLKVQISLSDQLDDLV